MCLKRRRCPHAHSEHANPSVSIRLWLQVGDDEGDGPLSPSPQQVCDLSFVFIFLLNSLTASVTRRDSLVALPHEQPLHMPNTKPHPRRCSLVLDVFPLHFNACRARKDTSEGVSSCSLPLMPRTELHHRGCRFVFNVFSSHAEHQKTPTRGSFRLLCPSTHTAQPSRV
jgi:hypothetical protein